MPVKLAQATFHASVIKNIEHQLEALGSEPGEVLPASPKSAPDRVWVTTDRGLYEASFSRDEVSGELSCLGTMTSWRDVRYALSVQSKSIGMSLAGMPILTFRLLSTNIAVHENDMDSMAFRAFVTAVQKGVDAAFCAPSATVRKGLA
jgi:hypothetical protein